MARALRTRAPFARPSSKAEQHLQQAQQRLSRRKNGSKRRTTARKLLAKTHQQVRRQRQDLHHTVARYFVRHYDSIYLEDLRVANLVRNPHLARVHLGRWLGTGAHSTCLQGSMRR